MEDDVSRESMFCAEPRTVGTAAEASAWASRASLEAACPRKESTVCAAPCGVGGGGGEGACGIGSWGGEDMAEKDLARAGAGRKGGPGTLRCCVAVAH